MSGSIPRRGLGLSLAVTLLTTAPLVSAAPAADHVPGELLVRFSDVAAERRLLPAIASLDPRPDRVSRGVRRLRMNPGTTLDSALAYLHDLDGVVIAQPNYRYRFTALPNDPDVPAQWAVENLGQTILGAPIYPFNNPGAPGADLALNAAWDVRSDCRGVVVAVIDSGVDYAHSDLSGAMWDGAPVHPNHGRDTFGPGDDDPAPDTAIPEDDHGTHVAGIIGAVGDNANGTTGVCWDAEIMAIRAGSFAAGLSTADVIEGIEFAIDNGASVLNMSFGGELPFDALFSAAIDEARAAGVLAVAAAGNDSPGVDIDGRPATNFYPCAFPQDNVICVAASDQADEWALFSNFGTTSVDLAAPGTNILSTSYFDGLDIKSGTSMATAQVTGLAALTWAQNPAYDYHDVREALLASGTTSAAWSGLTVSGRVANGDGMLRHLRPPTGLAYSLD